MFQSTNNIRYPIRVTINYSPHVIPYYSHIILLNNYTMVWFTMLSTTQLVGGFNPSEKTLKSVGMMIPIYGKIIQMFPTSNQTIYRGFPKWWHPEKSPF